MVGKVFDRIELVKANATKSELLLIEKIKLLDSNSLIYMSITELALNIGIGEATILRFCRKMGYKGFQDFKLNLSRDLSMDTNSNSTDEFKVIFDRMNDALQLTYDNVDKDKVKEIAKLIVNSGRVCFFGVGNSYISILAAKYKLIRIGIPVETSEDVHIQSIICSSLHENDVVFLFSVSGSTKDIIHLAELAKKKKAKIVVVTNYDLSPLASYADYLLVSSKKEKAYEGGTSSSIISQIYVIDMITYCLYDEIKDAKEMSISSSISVSDKSI